MTPARTQPRTVTGHATGASGSKAPEWHQLTPQEALSALDSSPVGLDPDVARRRLNEYAFNELHFKRRSALVRFLVQFHHPLIYVLLAAAIVCAALTLFTGEDMWSEVIIIMLVVVLNTIIGFVQEGKAEQALEALKRMMVAECRVLRAGEERVLATRKLVPGDIVLLQSGDKVPADLRVIESKNLTADEAPLTGESQPVKKIVDPITKPNLPPGDRRCIAFSWTFVTRGTGHGVVIATGERTEFGRIAVLMKETRAAPTPLQWKLGDFSRFLVYAILVVAALNFAMALLFGYKPTYAFLASVALAVAAVPEMLPPLVTIVLALAATAMAHRKALIRKLPAAETLGCVTVICSDKTGTLTKNQMTATCAFSGGTEFQISGTGYEPSGDFTPPPHAGLLEALRDGGVAPRSARNGVAHRRSASHTSFRLRACASCA